MKKPPPPAAEHKTLDKAMQILHAFSHEEPELGIGELSARLGIHKSIVSRLAGGLRAWQLLEQDPRTKLFRVGAGAFRLGAIYSGRQGLQKICAPFLSALVAQTHQTCHVAILDNTSMLVVATMESSDALRVIMRLGDRRALHATGGGKLMLAFVPGLMERLLEQGPLPALTPATITSVSKLKAEVDAAKRDRIAFNVGESTLGAGAVAAPILEPDGTFIAALSSVFPLGALNESQRRVVALKVQQAAQAISKAIAT
jgi:DNA-binding IclR family transcriptional regulator